ncbi:hypothetical protein [Nocardia australiensis]|uniref:hypothetical protein n=1 Tax=Nocardia australiensis TaxID=2887191 RepID=UPI001D14ABD2|nr:hypothetical protein [Nocardia australiensis]
MFAENLHPGRCFPKRCHFRIHVTQRVGGVRYVSDCGAEPDVDAHSFEALGEDAVHFCPFDAENRR